MNERSFVAANEPDPTVGLHLDLIAGLAVLVSLAGFVWLHAGFADVVDPVRQPVSSYALDPAGELGFAFGAIGMAVACGTLALRFTDRALPRWLLIAASVMYVLVVVFPTDAGVDVSSVGGQIHRYAAGVAFVAMTVLAIALAVSRNHGRSIVFFAALSALLLLLTTVNTFLPGLADGGAWRGVPQRALLVVHLGFLLGLVVSLRRADIADQARVRGTVTTEPRRGAANWSELMATWANGVAGGHRSSSRLGS